MPISPSSKLDFWTLDFDGLEPAAAIMGAVSFILCGLFCFFFFFIEGLLVLPCDLIEFVDAATRDEFSAMDDMDFFLSLSSTAWYKRDDVLVKGVEEEAPGDRGDDVDDVGDETEEESVGIAADDIEVGLCGLGAPHTTQASYFPLFSKVHLLQLHLGFFFFFFFFLVLPWVLVWASPQASHLHILRTQIMMFASRDYKSHSLKEVKQAKFEARSSILMNYEISQTVS